MAQVERNELSITGVILDVSSLRYTPGGVPYSYFTLEHRSRQTEADIPREVFCRIRVDLRGEALRPQMEQLEVGQTVEVMGFLARSGVRDDSAVRLVLHAQHLSRLSD